MKTTTLTNTFITTFHLHNNIKTKRWDHQPSHKLWKIWYFMKSFKSYSFSKASLISLIVSQVGEWVNNFQVLGDPTKKALHISQSLLEEGNKFHWLVLPTPYNVTKNGLQKCNFQKGTSNLHSNGGSSNQELSSKSFFSSIFENQLLEGLPSQLWVVIGLKMAITHKHTGWTF